MTNSAGKLYAKTVIVYVINKSLALSFTLSGKPWCKCVGYLQSGGLAKLEEFCIEQIWEYILSCPRHVGEHQVWHQFKYSFKWTYIILGFLPLCYSLQKEYYQLSIIFLKHYCFNFFSDRFMLKKVEILIFLNQIFLGRGG